MLVLLAIELFDELVFSAREAAWPLLRADLGLSYQRVGLLLSIPVLVGAVIEPAFGILGDTGRRRLLVLGGGIAYAAALALAAAAGGSAWLLVAFTLLSPAAGAFVSLTQATLVDLDPGQVERSMTRWTLAGWLGVAAGPLVLSAAAGLGASSGAWRPLLLALAAAALCLVAMAWRLPFSPGARAAAGNQTTAENQTAAGSQAPTVDREMEGRGPGVREVALRALAALRDREVLRWLVLLQVSNLMVEVLLSYLALYLVDVAGASPARASLGVAVWTGAGLAGNALLLVVLARIPGLRTCAPARSPRPCRSRCSCWSRAPAPGSRCWRCWVR